MLAVELGAAGVDGLERGRDAVGEPRGARTSASSTPTTGRRAGASEKPSRLARRQCRAVMPCEARCSSRRARSSVIASDLVEEPRVDRRSPRRARSTLTPRRSAASSWNGRSGVAIAPRAHELVVVELVERGLARIAVEPEAAVLERAQALLQRLGERAADGHRLADRLHLRAEHAARARELLERPPRHLGDDVVDGRLEAGRRLPGDVVRDLVERVADREPGRDLGDREAGGLRRERRRPADTRGFISMTTMSPFVGFDRELHVRAAGLDADAADARERGVAHRLVLDVGQRLRRARR